MSLAHQVPATTTPWPTGDRGHHHHHHHHPPPLHATTTTIYTHHTRYGYQKQKMAIFFSFFPFVSI
jgi:hypothetical protein